MPHYGYFWGCYVQGRLPHLEKSTRLVMERLGVDCGDLHGLTCCPEKTMVRTMGGQAWLLTAARNLAVGDEAGVDFVTPCPGCFATLKGAAAELRGRADVRAEVGRELEAVGRRYRGGARPRHVLEVLYEDVGLSRLREVAKDSLRGMRIAVHYGCHLLRPSAELGFDDPESPRKFDELVEALGAVSISYESKDACCGGLLSRVGDEETARAMARGKIRDVMEAGADAICLACPACMMQYDATQVLLQRRGEALQMPILYYTELLGLALGAEPKELGLEAHRVDVTPFLEKWKALHGGMDRVRAHWDEALLRACAECGACSAECSVSRTDPGFDPNQVIRQLAAGDVDDVLRAGEFWRCVECYRCHEMCFQRYSMLDIFRVAKRLAMEEGTAPAATQEGVTAFRRTGRLVEGAASRRKRLGLPPLPESGGEELVRMLDAVSPDAAGREECGSEDEA